MDGDGAVWAVNGYEEVGRHKYIDLSVSTYDTAQTGGVEHQDAGEFVPPDGWHLQDADGAPVRELTGLTLLRSERAYAFGLRAKVPPDGWRIAPGETMQEPTTVPVEVAGVDRTMTFSLRANTIKIAGYDSAAYEALADGGVIHIRSAT